MRLICLVMVLSLTLAPEALLAEQPQSYVQIYEKDLMSAEEFQQHIQRLKACKNDAERSLYLDEHQQRMQERAKAQSAGNVVRKDVSKADTTISNEFIRHE